MARRTESMAEGVVVAAVRAGGAAAAAGLAPGDRIVAINGEPLRDVIDFHFHAGEARLRLGVERGGVPMLRVLERRGRRPRPRARGAPALARSPPAPTSACSASSTSSRKGMRKSLYVKDDDFRLSFLHGNYITLTDLDEAELERIEAQRLSPLYVSVHATDPELRHRLLGSPRVKRDLLPIMERLAAAGIRMHAQIVLCPGWNDGPHLERTVHEPRPAPSRGRHDGVVPVGLTRHRERLPAAAHAPRRRGARALDGTVDGWQAAFRRRLGSRFVFGGDELYLQAGAPLPTAAAYEGFPVAEDGIGLVRRFEDAVPARASAAPARARPSPRSHRGHRRDVRAAARRAARARVGAGARA